METFKRIVLSIFAVPFGLIAGVFVGVGSFLWTILDIVVSLFQYIWEEHHEQSRIKDE